MESNSSKEINTISSSKEYPPANISYFNLNKSSLLSFTLQDKDKEKYNYIYLEFNEKEKTKSDYTNLKSNLILIQNHLKFFIFL